ncbi:ATPase, P-type (transporting), HAD superfamily, subfamily IC [Thalassoporum mexicanum PCC 7367]|uniref:cation-translocating P-type ATPase n=1 Tax=Thalassoporum mexicanum TaxID=3457544 RepID=UPI00029FF7E4|nr:cation-translocating P-type ATPase [Pseudanabaena sp. PCC 7367]AFY70464.1 ATPase, P-type (transporting), HAD superfamily, subfamily IC [Pseudanabaena sp. PCC 7367]
MASPLPSKDWHTVDWQDALRQLDVDQSIGLEQEQISDRQASYGKNEIQGKSLRSKFSILLDQFTNIMLIMLMSVAVISAGISLHEGEFPKDAIAIAVIVILNGILGYVQESRAEEALAALKKLSAPNVRVMRAGQIREISAKELVPGDIVFIETGVQISADGRLLEAFNLRVREAALTGEAQAVHKSATQVCATDEAIGDRQNMVFQGTEVIQGRGKFVVTATAMKTELGKVASMLQSVENEPTPLQLRMNQLGNVLVYGSLSLVLLVVGIGLLRGGEFLSLLETSLSMAVAVVPEGLPAVITVTLAIGTQRMVKRHALIRKLPAVETLGSVTTICSDKTGTLTQNKMVVETLYTPSYMIQVSGSGYVPTGEFTFTRNSDDQLSLNITIDDCLELRSLLTACVLCNDAHLQQDESGHWGVVGDPTEGALLTLAAKAEFEQTALEAKLPRQAEVPFSAERKRMSVVCQSNQSQIVYSKGSPELLLEKCDRIFLDHEISEITARHRQNILSQNETLAQAGIRVLGFAQKEIVDPAEQFHESAQATEVIEQNLVWLGLVGMRDAPRLEVADAVHTCKIAGIRPIMITGDHQLTAMSIAKDLGIANPSTQSMSGAELEKIPDSELDQVVRRVSVYARVSPEHKLRIVRSLQRGKEFVAMTGDGVNDAPALKQANIGIAMGITGTDVSKEASEMILLDDNFATIVAATEEGRVVYTNIRRFIKYILGSNVGEVLTIAASPFLGLPEVPLTPLQILWMNLVTDGVPALALAVEPAEPDIMRRSPYSPTESIFARGLGAYIIRIGIIFGLLTIILMQIAYSNSDTIFMPEHWKSMVFTTLCIAQMGHAMSARSDHRLLIELNLFSNPFLLAAVICTTALQLALLYVKPLQVFFGTQPLTGTELAVCFGFSMLVLVWVEMEKLVIRWYMGRKHQRG